MDRFHLSFKRGPHIGQKITGDLENSMIEFLKNPSPN